MKPHHELFRILYKNVNIVVLSLHVQLAWSELVTSVALEPTSAPIETALNCNLCGSWIIPEHRLAWLLLRNKKSTMW
jgi:hypothetical protein